MLSEKSGKVHYTPPSVKGYGSVSDLVGTTFGGPGAQDGMTANYNS